MAQMYFDACGGGLINVNFHGDVYQAALAAIKILLNLFYPMMFFSKSFGYALRGVIYIAASSQKPRVCVEELADHLKVPRHFMGKVMKALVKNDILHSTKGPTGGFSLNERTLDTPLIRILETTDGQKHFDLCVLRFTKCNSQNPCPLHPKIEETRDKLSGLLSDTRIKDLLTDNSEEMIRSLISE
jgi:Rrf2 family transcriptional regulator, iron-sulfur cluster assembly transcription factor